MAAPRIIELSIRTNYVLDWTRKEGIREFVQNARDAHQTGAPMSIDYDGLIRCLTIRTAGRRLETETLLLGGGEDKGSAAVGRWREGYKLGSLALVRDGKNVEIRTGAERWVPKFVRSKVFSTNGEPSPVLAFEISDVPKRDAVEDIIVTIGGISPQEWEEDRMMFLFGRHPGRSSVHKLIGYGYCGNEDRGGEVRILKSSEEKGNVYVGGIFVSRDPELRFGYDMNPADFPLDRDRRTLDAGKLREATTCAWQSAFVDALEEGDRALADEAWALFQEDVPDIAEMAYGGYRNLFMDAADKYFRDRFVGAHPVTSLDEQVRATVFGIRSVIVSERVRRFLGKFERIQEIEKTRENAILETWDASDLPRQERSFFSWARDLVLAAWRKNMAEREKTEKEPPVLAARFGGPAVLGLHVDGTIYVRRDLLADPRKNVGIVIGTLVHEFAHHDSESHGSALLRAVERIYDNVTVALISGGTNDFVNGPAFVQDHVVEVGSVPEDRSPDLDGEEVAVAVGSEDDKIAF